AMAHGRPVAITRGCGGVLGAVRDGESGIVVNVGDMDAMAERVAALAADCGILAAMARAARLQAESAFDIRVLASRYDALVGEAWQAARAGPGPAGIAAMWARMLAALELLGPSTPAELAGLAAEWLADIGAANVALHLTEDSADLLDAIAQHGAG